MRGMGLGLLLTSCVTQRTLVKLDDGDAVPADSAFDGSATDTEPAEASEPPSVGAASPDPVLDETATLTPIDTSASTPTTPVDTGDSGCGPNAWAVASFAFPQDALSCSGPQLVRYDATAGLWVGVVGCAQGFLRIYLAPSASGPFVQATDLAGHGQDHCALIVPGWTLPNEDDITSGGCATCATSVNLPIEGAPTYARAFLGQPWTFYPTSGAWSWQTSRLFCGDVPAACGP